ncbi:MAG: type IX secretion system protein PorQ [Thermonemataceae bacterium]|nr:type IX secretion system protein PorQ [Thermonemataceae bacterium]
MYRNLLFFLFFISFPIRAQINGGNSSFEFLRLSANPRTNALGGLNNSLGQGDVNMFFNNPALLDSSMNEVASLNFSSFYANIPHFLLSYAYDFGGKVGQIGMGVQYIRYGKIQETDEAGNVMGDFMAADYAIIAGKSFKANNFQIGLNLKFIASQLASYSAFALATDLGASFKHPDKDLSIGLSLHNIGFPIKSFLSENAANLPFDARIGVSFKPQYMPLRFSATAHHLYKWDIGYNDPTFANSTDPFTGEEQSKKISFADNLFRHFVFGTELLIHKNFHLLFGYNHLRNRELKYTEAANMAGFSGGVSFKVKGWEFAYTRASFNGKARSFLALSKNIKDFRKD